MGDKGTSTKALFQILQNICGTSQCLRHHSGFEYLFLDLRFPTTLALGCMLDIEPVPKATRVKKYIHKELNTPMLNPSWALNIHPILRQHNVLFQVWRYSTQEVFICKPASRKKSVCISVCAVTEYRHHCPPRSQLLCHFLRRSDI